jgi:hypothetical protein
MLESYVIPIVVGVIVVTIGLILEHKTGWFQKGRSGDNRPSGNINVSQEAGHNARQKSGISGDRRSSGDINVSQKAGHNSRQDSKIKYGKD